MSKSSQPLSCLLTGCGGIAGSWLKHLAMRDDLRLVGFCDLDPAAAARRRDEFAPAAAVGRDLAAMLAALKPDLVCDCTIPAAHAQVACAALAAGCHVLAEKPLAASMDEARRIRAAAAVAGRTHAVMQNRRFLPQIRRYRDFLQGGVVGALGELHVDFRIGAHFGGFRAEMDHPLLLDMAIHTLDQARFLLGRRPLAVSARAWNPPHSWYRHGGSALVWAAFEGGLTFTYRGSWCSDGGNTSWEGDWNAIGALGSARWDGQEAVWAELAEPGQQLVRAVRRVEAPPPPAMPFTGHAGCLDDMIRAIREGRRPETDGDDNLHSLALVHAAIASAARGGAEITV